MSLFLDTGILVEALNEKDPLHRQAVAILRAGMNGRWGRLITSDDILDEAVTLAKARTHTADGGSHG